MNYKSVVAENQSNHNACTKACDDASKARMETVPGKYYTLLPLWTVDPLISQESKSYQDDGFQPSSDDGKKMPELEDINTFTFSYEDENNGAEADMNNLDTTIQDPSWIEAMKEELLQFKLQEVWTLVDLPYGKRAIGTKWVFGNKKDERVATVEAIRLFLAYASFNDFMVYQMDFKSSFLYEKIEEETKTINEEVQLQALVDEKKVIKTESTVRRDLQLEDAEEKLTFYKGFFSPQWKFLIHTILQCISAKTTAWNEFSRTMAFTIICLATNQKFNFSKFIFESMMKNLDNVNKFLMYPRVGKDFSRRVTPLFLTMMVQAQEEIDEAVNGEIDDSLERAATTATSLDTEQDRKLCTKLQQRVLDLETTKTTQALVINSLKKRVKKLEMRNRSRINRLKRLYKVRLLVRVESSKDEGLGKEDASKQGMIADIDANKGIYLVNVHTDKDIFGVNDLDGDEVIIEDAEMLFDIADELRGEEVFISQEVTFEEVITAAATTTTAIIDDITLAKAVMAIKSAKPKAAKTTAATTITTASSRPKAKGLVIHEKEQAPTSTISLQQPSHLQAKKEEEEEEEERIPREKSHQIEEVNIAWDDVQAKIDADYELAQRLQAKEQDELTDAERKNSMKKVNSFVDFRTELVEESSKKTEAETTQEGSLKRVGDELEQERYKKQKVEDDKKSKELKKCLEIIPDDGDDVTIDATPLSSIKMLKNFDREDLKVLWRLVKGRYKKVNPVNHMDSFLLHNLKTKFEHHVEDNVRILEFKSLHEVTAVKVHVTAAKQNLVLFSLVILVFSPRDDPIACLNKAMDFLIAVASSRFLPTNNQLITSLNLINQATIQDGRVTVQQVHGRQGESYFGTGYKSNATCSGETLQVDRQGLLNATTVKTKDLNTYDSDCDEIWNAKAILMANISNYGSDIISETLNLEEASRSKMARKYKDPEAVKQKNSNKPIDYVELNKIYEDFGKRFVPQQELSADEAVWYNMLNPSTKSFVALPIQIEVPMELPKLQEKDITICKLKEIMKTMRENSKEENVNYDYCEIATKIVEMENSVAKLLLEIERLCNEINHVKQVFKEQFDLIKKTRVRTKEQSMFKLDLEPLAPRLLQNREIHLEYLKNTQEQADILRGIVEQAKAKQPLDNALDFASNVVPPKKTTSHSVETQKPELKVYSRKPKNVKNVGSTKKAKIVESKNANHSKPIHTWGSNAIDILLSSSLVMTVRFGNVHISRIMGYGDYQLGNVTISRVYYIKGLGNNLFFVGQFCDADLKVSFWKNTCFIRNLEAYALGKSKKSSHQPKAEDTNQKKLYLLHMDLCGPMHVAIINGKSYILVIVDDYSRYMWVRFLRSKYEAPKAIIKCIKNIQVRLNATVRNVRTDNGTEFVNQILREFFENVGISHQTSVACTPQQNGIVERRNQTLVEAAHIMLIFFKA
nr:putative ribonuclease H-like domain-containing protein [Tanacetum cinerariifolium]